MAITRLGQNRHEFKVGAAAKDFNLCSIKGAQIVKATHIVLYNSHAAQTVTFYIGIRRNGKFHRHHYKATLAAADVENCYTSLYLHAGDELIINAIGSGAETTFEVVYQLLDVGPNKP
jgi:hypothetical protein